VTLRTVRRLRNNALEPMLVLGAAALLLADTFAPWQRLSQTGFSYSWNAWHSDKGIVVGVLIVALIVWSAARVVGIRLPNRLADDVVTLTLPVFTLVFVIVKNVRDDYRAWGGYLGIALALVAAAGTLLAYQEPEARAGEPRAADTATR
jgi:hypothetical protein